MKKIFLLLTACSVSFISFAQGPEAVSILGDSYSTFEGYIQPDSNKCWYYTQPRHQTDVTSVDQTWWYQLTNGDNYKLEVNNSYSGSTICNTGYNKEDYTDRSFLTRMKELGSPDIIFIFGGTNDSWARSPIGEYQFGEWTKDDLYSFRPALACLLAGMKEYYPDTTVYFILNNELSEAVNESVELICKHFGVDCILLQDIDKLSGHPSVKGMTQICKQVEEYLK